MQRLPGRNKVHFLLLSAALALLLTTACMAEVFGGEYGDSKTISRPMVMLKSDGATGLGREHGGPVAPYDGASGIWVTGTGVAAGVPDVAVISLGVEAVEDTAVEARANAAAAMEGVMQVLADAEIEDRDIQTRYFNISPRYRSVQVTDCGDEPAPGKSSSEDKACETYWKQQLTGYAVSNQVSVKIRSLDDAGTIIDQVTDAAGDLVRVNGVSFAIEDPQEPQDAALADAVADMKRKAGMLAELSGLELGRLVYLTEEASYLPPQPIYERAVFLSAADAGAPTSISAGELEFTAHVQGVYLIAKPKPEPNS